MKQNSPQDSHIIFPFFISLLKETRQRRKAPPNTLLARRGSSYIEERDRFYVTHRGTYVSAQTHNLPVLELAFPFPVLAPISSTVLF